MAVAPPLYSSSSTLFKPRDNAAIRGDQRSGVALAVIPDVAAEAAVVACYVSQRADCQCGTWFNCAAERAGLATLLAEQNPAGEVYGRAAVIADDDVFIALVDFDDDEAARCGGAFRYGRGRWR